MTVGVLGTMVWDRIEHPDGEIVERWGGITYSLAAAAAALPDAWRIRPIIRLGTDLAEQAWAFLRSVPGLELPGGVMEVDEPNNRVHLRYRDRHHRDEYLSGGVAGWPWDDLAPHLEGLDGLFVNMISGFELDHEGVASLRDEYPGPRYADLHSLLLGVGPDGRRVPRRPEHGETWLAAFDALQLNERELGIMAGEEAADALPARAVRAGTRAVFVTRGPRGAAWFAHEDGPMWPSPEGAASGGHERREGAMPSGEVVSGDVPLESAWTVGDPTGCGDVWGATCFVTLMRGRTISQAAGAANRAAARNVSHRGADTLYQHLRAQT